MSHSFRIIVIIITKVNIIKIYNIHVSIMTKEYNNIKVCIIKVYIIIRENNFIKCFRHFTRKNQEQNLVVKDKNRQLYYTFFEFCIDQEHQQCYPKFHQ